MSGIKRLISVALLFAFVVGLALVELAGARELDGAKVYRDNCGKCHSERSPMEKTDNEWRVVITQMRVIAGLSARESRAVLKFLQENNGEG